MPPGLTLIILGAFLLAGFAANVVGARAHVPRVTLLLLLGVTAGPGALDLVPKSVEAWFPFVAQLALSMVGFALGEQFLGSNFRKSGRIVVIVAIVETLAAAIAVGIGLLAVGTPLPVALLLAGIAPATAPAATMDVVRECGAKGPVTRTLLGVAAIDDAFGIMLFSLLLAVAQFAVGQDQGSFQVWHGIWEIAGALGLGAAIGLPMAWLTGRARPGMLTLMETLGFVLLTSGLALLLDVSYLLACITLGAIVANFASHHTRPFHAIEGVSQPFLVLFFLLAGFELDVYQLPKLGVLGATYCIARSAGLILGGGWGAKLANAPESVRKHIGWCLLPQAGVALGLALIGARQLGDDGASLLALLVGTTFLFEVIGPISTRIALTSAGEVPLKADASRHG